MPASGLRPAPATNRPELCASPFSRGACRKRCLAKTLLGKNKTECVDKDKTECIDKDKTECVDKDKVLIPRRGEAAPTPCSRPLTPR